MGTPLENEFHIYVRIWADEWRCLSLSCQFSFVIENIDQEETSTTRPHDEMRDRLLAGPDQTWAIARELASACDRSSNRESRRDQLVTQVASRCLDQLLFVRPRPVRPGNGTIMRLEIPFRHARASCSFLPGRCSR